MQRVADYKYKFVMACIALSCIALVANHFTGWSAEKIKSTCQEDPAATASAANHDIAEKRVIPQGESRATVAIWNCPDGKVRTTVIQR